MATKFTIEDLDNIANRSLDAGTLETTRKQPFDKLREFASRLKGRRQSGVDQGTQDLGGVNDLIF